jgi:hypothetical protein
MVSTVFYDEIVNATQLRAKQSHWLSVATKRPVTVTYGTRKLTIIDREKIRNLFLQAHYLELFVKYCDEIMKGTKINTFPWLEYLDDEEKRQFRDEYLGSIRAAIVTEHWEDIETLLDDWKATAETNSNEEAVRALKTKEARDKYITLKE